MAKVLVVDDARFMRNVVKSCVLEAGQEVVEATNGQECLDMIERECPALVILDLVMPVLDGFAVLEKLNEMASPPPVIVMTADIQKSVRDRVIESGARSFLNKPPERDVLVAAIQSTLAEVAAL